MGLPKEWFIEGDLLRPNYKPPFQLGWVPRKPAVGEYLQYPQVFDADGRTVGFGRGDEHPFFSDPDEVKKVAELLNSGIKPEDINIRDLGGRKAKARSALREKSYASAPIPEGMFIRRTEEVIGMGLFLIGRTNPGLAAQIKEKIADNLVGLDPEKTEERVKAIKQLVALPEEANPLKEAIVFRFIVHPGDGEREASLLLIPSVTEEERRKALLQRTIDWDPNREIVAKAKALLGK